MAKKSKELIAALKEELLGYKRAGKKDRAKAVEAELKKAGVKTETAAAKPKAETAAKKKAAPRSKPKK